MKISLAHYVSVLLFKHGGASLVAQWLRICLPMQGTRVRALVWEDPTCRGATRPVSHNLLSLRVWSLCSATEEAAIVRGPRTAMKRTAVLAISFINNSCYWTSLVVQWLRIRLPMQGTQVRSLVREDPTYHGATKPVRHNYRACALEPASHNYRSLHT
ncbi:hypothetical protein J1605_000323 [Eschrichtius robustus]|uniref:Secreted protein n=1 Tax=Eschrichtius robustus TaxID=9764 RepID=A0AB34HMA0_ESCRO|nr:hypothetical protein J1605_000323 [Eschrichtius robustus]